MQEGKQESTRSRCRRRILSLLPDSTAPAHPAEGSAQHSQTAPQSNSRLETDKSFLSLPSLQSRVILFVLNPLQQYAPPPVPV